MNSSPRVPAPPLKFQFEHVGPVEDAELELGNLTVIAGRNNTGKTYLVYTVYGFLKYFQGNARRRMDKQPEYSRWIDAFARDFRTKGQTKCPIDQEMIANHRRELTAEHSKYFSEILLPDVFSSPKSDFKASSISVRMDEHAPNIITPVERENLLQYDGQHLMIASEELLWEKHPRSHLTDQYIRLLVPELFADISIISAERFGISLFYKELDFAKNQLVQLLQELRHKGYSMNEGILHLISDHVSSHYALPIKDNIHFTRSIAQFKKQEGDLIQEILFKKIEELMDGTYTASDDEIRFLSRQVPESELGRNRAFDIPLHRASSSARGLADLYFLLKHRVRPNQILLIDEPESHLDTENQVLLARVLAYFARAGIRVLITTHSDYLLKEINNLIMLSGDFEDKEMVKKELGYSSDDALAPELIRAYVAEDGGLSRCRIDSFGIDMPTFDQVIDKINRASNKLAGRVGTKREVQQDTERHPR